MKRRSKYFPDTLTDMTDDESLKKMSRRVMYGPWGAGGLSMKPTVRSFIVVFSLIGALFLFGMLLEAFGVLPEFNPAAR